MEAVNRYTQVYPKMVPKQVYPGWSLLIIWALHMKIFSGAH